MAYTLMPCCAVKHQPTNLFNGRNSDWNLLGHVPSDLFSPFILNLYSALCRVKWELFLSSLALSRLYYFRYALSISVYLCCIQSANYSVTRSILQSVCDSWAYCYLNSHNKSTFPHAVISWVKFQCRMIIIIIIRFIKR